VYPISGSESGSGDPLRGAVKRASADVYQTASVPLTSIDALHEAAQISTAIVRDEEAAGSNPATPTQ
jgi:hypothetical protein